MHMADSVGMSSLSWFSDYFSLPVSEILNFFSFPLPQTAASKQYQQKGEGRGNGVTYSAKAVYILRWSAWAVGIICPLPNLGYRCFTFFPLGPCTTGPSTFFSLSMNLYVISL